MIYITANGYYTEDNEAYIFDNEERDCSLA